MKSKLIVLLVLLLVSMGAHAEWIARAKTTKGGDIVLTAGTCKNAPSRSWARMYVATDKGALIWGCYMLTELHIMVVFDDGTSMAYDYSGWTVNNKDDPKPQDGGSSQRF